MKRGVLATPTFAFETWGNLNDDRSNGVLLFTGLSPSAHAASPSLDPSAGWSEDMIGPNKPLDTTRYFVICINSLGSCFGFTGPASIDPENGSHYRSKNFSRSLAHATSGSSNDSYLPARGGVDATR